MVNCEKNRALEVADVDSCHISIMAYFIASITNEMTLLNRFDLSPQGAISLMREMAELLTHNFDDDEDYKAILSLIKSKEK